MLARTVSVSSVGPHKGSSPGSATRGRGTQQATGSSAGGRVFAMTLQDAHATPEVVTGKLSIANKDLYALIDPGSTHSFVASDIVSYLGRPCSFLNCALYISTPMESVILMEHVYKDCVLRMGE